MAIAALDEESERSLVHSLIHDLNEFFSTGLSEDPVIDRFLDKEVFLSENSKRQQLIQIGESHLNRMADQLSLDKWELVNLCKP